MMRFDLEKMTAEQLALAKKVSCKDSFDNLETVGGLDVTCTDNMLVAGIVVMHYPSLEIIEHHEAVMPAQMPYIAGFLCYRHIPVMTEVYAQCQEKPDVLLINAHGILHPRRIGCASQFGLLSDQATIGVAKQLLSGTLEGDDILLEGKKAGRALKTKEFAKEIFVSPGHKVSLKTATKIVQTTLTRHKLPEPLHIAHKFANKLKKEQKFKKESAQ